MARRNFGVPAQFWLNLQNDDRMTTGRRPANEGRGFSWEEWQPRRDSNPDTLLQRQMSYR